MTYTVKKHFGHDRGYTVAFRQWKAAGTHCSQLHGYALSFTFEISGDDLDHRNWLYSFGDFKDIKAYLDEYYDHTTLIAEDDPMLDIFKMLHDSGACTLKIVEKVGCEAIAKSIYDRWVDYIWGKTKGRAELKSVTVAEHAGNSVTYTQRV